MAPGFHFSWLLVSWLVVTTAEGTGVGECIRWCGGYFRSGDSVAKYGAGVEAAREALQVAITQLRGGKLCLRRSDLGTTREIQGQDVMTPPGGSQNNGNPTDCQIITLTPPPSTRTLLTRAQPVTRTPTFYFPPRRPGFYPRFPNTPFFLPNNRRFQFWPFYPPRGRLIPWRLFLRRWQLQSRSSSEESMET